MNTKFKLDKQSAAIILFFLAYLAIGLSCFRDFGISWDEGPEMKVAARAQSDFSYHTTEGRTHLFSLTSIMLLADKMLGLTDPRDMFLNHHLIMFLFFYIGVIVFYFLLKSLFTDRILSLLGCLFLVISPRIFAQSFYNPKDIPFLVISIFGFYTLKKMLDTQRKYFIFLHVFMCLAAYHNRVAGLFLILMTIFYMLIDIPRSRVNSKKNLLLYTLSMLALVIITDNKINPLNILGNLTQTVVKTVTHEHSAEVLFFGKWINASSLPWYYTPAWVIISTPITYLILFAIGFASFLIKFFIKPPMAFQEKRDLSAYALWIIIPLAAPIILKTTLFDAWRHHYFIYPFIIIFAVAGLKTLFQKSICLKNAWRTIIPVFLSIVIAFDISMTALFMIRNHPFQDIYFNALCGGIKGASGKFELDYWGVSYRNGLEYLLKMDKSDLVITAVGHVPGKINHYILPLKQRLRLRTFLYPCRPFNFVSFNDQITLKKVSYLVTTYRWIKEHYAFKELKTITVDGVPILWVYELP